MSKETLKRRVDAKGSMLRRTKMVRLKGGGVSKD